MVWTCLCESLSLSLSLLPASGDYINGVFRDTWNWTGFIVSDCDAVNLIYSTHHYAATGAASASAAINAGVDLDCGPFYQDFLPQAVNQGLVTNTTLRTAARRVLRSQFQLGEFDDPSKTPYGSLNLGEIGAPQHQQQSLEASRQSIVLLKNENNILPLKSPTETKTESPTAASATAAAPATAAASATKLTVAIIGPHANSTLDLLGNDYMKDNKVILQNSPLAVARRLSNVDVTYAAGCDDGLQCNQLDAAGAIKVAQAADVAVVFLGISETFENEGHDRTELELPGQQLQLGLAVSGVQPKTVVVLYHGGMVLIDELVNGNATHPGAGAILTNFYPGQTGGQAVFDTLFAADGAVPSGKLPYTWYRRGFVQDRGAPNDQDLRSRMGQTYRFYTGKPLLPFGHGLSYSQVTTQLEEPLPSTMSTTDFVARGLTVHLGSQNSGDYDTDAVVLLFASLSGDGTQNCPKQTLSNFTRVGVKAKGGTVKVTVHVGARQVACVDIHGVARVPGNNATLTLTLEAAHDAPPLGQVVLTGSPATLGP